jgi:protein-L-isoaspartate(D-aspartate) O-methyltransferase
MGGIGWGKLESGLHMGCSGIIFSLLTIRYFMATAAREQPIDFYQSRQNMVDGQIRTNKVTDHALIRRLRQVPREIFVPPPQQAVAYLDGAVPLNEGRFLPEPMVLARLIQAADLTPTDKVLIVGCATGYSAAIIAPLAGRVIAVDISSALLVQAKKNLEQLQIANVQLAEIPSLLSGRAGDGPYDVILLEGSVTAPPQTLADQLAIGGRMLFVQNAAATGGIVSPMGQAMLYTKTGPALAGRVLFDANMPALPAPKPATAFIF